MKKISSVSELKDVLMNAKAGGRYVTIYAEKEITLRKFPTDDSERIRLADGFKPISHFSVQFHFGADYEKAVEKKLGTSFVKAQDDNRETLIPNVMMRYKSTDNVCLIYMPENRHYGDTTLNGKVLTADELAYMEHYVPRNNSNAIVEYRTISARNVKKLVINKEVYEVSLS